MTSLLRKPLAKKVVAAVAVKEIVDRIQEARQPRRSFLRRNAGKIVLLGLAGAGFVAWQRSKLTGIESFGQAGAIPSRRDPAIEPDERLDTSLRVPETTEASTTPSPAGR
jgi:hypothetical protein